MNDEIIGMILSLIGMALTIISFQARSKRMLLVWQTAGSTFFMISYLFSEIIDEASAPLPEDKDSFDELKAYIARIPLAEPDTQLFLTSKTQLHRTLTAASEKAGLPRITIHCFRHSHITYLINKGWSAPVVAARVGHESIYITTHYMHAYSEMENAICEMMDKDMT